MTQRCHSRRWEALALPEATTTEGPFVLPLNVGITLPWAGMVPGFVAVVGCSSPAIFTVYETSWSLGLAIITQFNEPGLCWSYHVQA